MSNWPLLSGAGIDPVGRLTSGNSGLTVITASGTAHVKGSYGELIASTARRLDGFTLITRVGNNTAGAGSIHHGLIDLAIGGAGSEEIVIPDLHVHWDSAGTACVYVPFVIPKSVRVSARWQSSVVSLDRLVGISGHVVGNRWPMSFQRAVAIGADTATSKGTSVDAGGTANTEGAWTQLIASTSSRLRALLVTVAPYEVSFSGATSTLVSIGVGAASSEVTIAEHVCQARITGSADAAASHALIPVDIPSGARIAARARSTNTTAANRTASVSLIGFY